MEKTLQFSLAIVLMIAINSYCANAQELNYQICGFEATVQEANFEEPINPNTNVRVAADLIIPIQFTVFREETCDNDKYKITVAKIQKVIDDINDAKYFQPYPLSIAKFNLVGVKFVIDPNLATIPDATIKPDAYSKDGLLFAKTPQNNAIQVCIVKTPRSYGKRFPENLIVLSEYKIDDAVNTFKLELAHELGHYFGLLHTHDQTEHKLMGLNSSEFADRSNSWAAGDKVYDTFADPRADQCTYSICDDGQTLATATNNLGCSELDLNTNPNATVRKYNPDMFNIMGYYYPAYRCGGKNNLKKKAFHFSDTQLGIMNGILFKRKNLTEKPATGFVVEDFHAGEIKSQCGNPDAFGEEYKGLTVNILYPNQAAALSYNTNDCGRYYGANNTYMPNQGSVNINVSDDTNYRFRVNMADVADIARHVLRVKPLSNAYQMIAADVNQNGLITSYDVVQLHKLVNNKIQTLAPTPSWSFLSKYYEKDVPNFVNTNPFSKLLKGNGYPNYLNKVTIDHAQSVNFDVYEPESWSFSAIKMGDVVCTSLKISEVDYIQILDVINNTNTNLQVGTSYTAQVQLANTAEVDAYQFAIKGNSAIEIESVELINSNEDFLNFDKPNNTIYNTWYNQNIEKVTQAAQSTLYTIKFKVLQPIENVQNLFRIERQNMESLAFDENKAIIKMPLIINILGQNSAKIAKTTNNLSANAYPNPIIDELFLRFTLKEESVVSIVLTDIYGKIIQRLETQGYSGRNELTFNNLPISGLNMIQYQILTNEGNFQGKVLVKK